MRVAVLGQGYVGLTTAVHMAECGHLVTGIESDSHRLASLLDAQVPFHEPGLDDALNAAMNMGSLRFSESLRDLAEPIDVVMVAVGTPALPSGATDLRYATAAISQITEMDLPPSLVVMKSTLPPGTSIRLLSEFGGRWNPKTAYVYNPEFLSQGNALDGSRNPSRIVVGLLDKASLQQMRQLYDGNQSPWVVTTCTTAEMIKYASNAFLATKVSFINEIANLCDDVGADIETVAHGIGLDSRIGTHFLKAGVGYGGSCFPKDTRSLAHLSVMNGRSMPLLEAVITVNQSQRLRVVRMVREGLQNYNGAKVAILGLSFKPGTDDIREAPSVPISTELCSLGLQVALWDPIVRVSTVESTFGGGRIHASMESAMRNASAVIVLTEWPEIVHADWPNLSSLMTQPRLVIDGRNCLDPSVFRGSSVTYRGIGRDLHAGDSQSEATW